MGIIFSLCIIPAHAQISSEFGYELHPGKLLENTEGTLQVFVKSNDMMVPTQISNLKAVSSDNSIIEIVDIKEGSDKFTKNIILKANQPGIVNIALAAEGFSSKEIALEVFNNNNHPTQILMKITPNAFPIDGPKYGHIAVEIATTGGIPTLASEDITINLNTPNKDIISIKNSEIVIKAGEYFGMTEFDIVSSGDAIIFAETEGMKKISEIVEVLEPIKPLKLNLYTYPETYNSYSGTKGYAIVQLVDGEDLLMLAEEDIHFKLTAENPDVSINTSHDFEEINFANKELVIKKGEYSTYTEFTPRLNLGDSTEDHEQSFNIFISAEDYLTSGSQITIIHDQIGAIEGEGPSITKVLPFLTTGKQEIIAVTYYETEIEVARQVGGNIGGVQNRELVTVTVPVHAKDDHKIPFSSSDNDVVKPVNPLMEKADNVALVFGETGTVTTEDSTIFSITDNQGIKTETAIPVGPIEDDMELVVESLLPMIMAEKDFPAIAYLVEQEDEDAETTTDDDEEEEKPRLGATPFIEDSVLTFSANEFVNADHVIIEKNKEYAIVNMESIEVSSTTLPYQMGGFTGNMEVTTHTTDPAALHLSHSKNILANSNTLSTVQLMDSAGNPVYAKEDVKIKLVSNNEQIMKIPEELTIKSGEYFTKFEFETIDEGEIELALLSENMPLTKYDINVVDISPVLTLNLIGGLSWNERIEAQLQVSIPEIETSLSGFDVEWEVTGGEIKTTEEVTNSAGIATMNVIANDKDTVSITAKVSGNGLSSSTLSKNVDILNMPVLEETVVEETPELGLPLDMNTIILIAIPVGIGGALFMLKRMDKLDMISEKLEFITEKIPMSDKIEEVKEKISDIRNR